MGDWTECHPFAWLTQSLETEDHWEIATVVATVAIGLVMSMLLTVVDVVAADTAAVAVGQFVGWRVH